MSVRVVIGAQWGDEGKGKIVDHLGTQTDYVVRYQGGANAGHTLVIGDTKMVLHLIPSGIFHNHAKCVIGNGVVIDPTALVNEIEEVRKLDINLKDRLFISEAAHVILPYHKQLDTLKEESKGDDAIGTTGRGIGPAYAHKVTRIGIRMVDLLEPEILKKKLKNNLSVINVSLQKLYGKPALVFEDIYNELCKSAEILKPYITNTTNLLHRALEEKKSVLLEGAQGSLLDIDHGTYPFVTSSSPTAGGACTGSGISPLSVTSIAGISKAYCTRVGNGPFPTELHDETGELLRKNGNEFGATTGRPRRCGWLDLVALRYAVNVNGISELVVTKMDVLDAMETIKACTAYRINGEITEVFPISTTQVEQAEPVYKIFEGWDSSVGICNSRDELPAQAQNYLNFIEEFLEVKITILSTGPKRSETLVL